jgi:hypothetical protein
MARTVALFPKISYTERHADGSDHRYWFRNSIHYVRSNIFYMNEPQVQLTDALVITKRFRSPNEFSIYIDEIVTRTKAGYMEAVIAYCDEKDIEIDSIGPLINQKLREKIQMEAEVANMIKPIGHLPV